MSHSNFDWWDLLAFVVLVPFVEFFGGMLGYLIVLMVSLGQVRLSTAGDEVSFPWHGFSRTHNGHLVVQESTVTLIGSMALLAGVIAFVAWRAGAFRA